MRVLICGSREWYDPDPMWREVLEVRESSGLEVIIHGGARGADKLAGAIAKQLKIKVMEFPAEWDAFGKKAGPMRNQKMLDEGKPDLVLAFHEDYDNSKGTRDMVKKATRAKIPVKIFSE